MKSLAQRYNSYIPSQETQPGGPSQPSQPSQSGSITRGVMVTVDPRGVLPISLHVCSFRV